MTHMDTIVHGMLRGINNSHAHAVLDPSDSDTIIVDRFDWAERPFQLRVWLPPHDLEGPVNDEAQHGDLKQLWTDAGPEERVKRIMLVHFLEFEEDLMDLDNLNVVARWQGDYFYVDNSVQ